MNHRKLEFCIILTLGSILAAPSAFGQTTSATLTCVVHDPSGAVVPGAVVRAIEARTHLSFETVTALKGTFGFPVLQPDDYAILETAHRKNRPPIRCPAFPTAPTSAADGEGARENAETGGKSSD